MNIKNSYFSSNATQKYKKNIKQAQDLVKVYKEAELKSPLILERAGELLLLTARLYEDDQTLDEYKKLSVAYPTLIPRFNEENS